MKQRLAIFALIGLLIFGGILISTKDRGQIVNIATDPAAIGKIIAPRGEGGGAEKTFAKFKGVYSGKLAKGQYDLVVTGDKNYKDYSRSFVVDSQPVTIKVSLEYSEVKLGEQLQQELPSIFKAFSAKLPILPPGYSLDSGQLYERGDWFGGYLKPTDTLNKDTLRYVMHKQNGQWSLVTDPPDIVISSILYPQIPRSLLLNLNRF